jgi:tetratricopeptide (TPR) repeat protein
MISAAWPVLSSLSARNRHIGDLDTYQKFLRARAMVHSRGYGTLAEGTTLLEEVTASDPEYAPAWAYLAQAYVFGLNYHPAWLSGDFETLRPLVAELMPKAEAAARRAVELDPSLADGYALLGLTLELRGDLPQAEDLYRRAIALDPFVPIYNVVTSWLFWLNGETDVALALSAALPPFHRGYASPRLLAALGRYQEAADLIAGNAPGMFLPGVTEAAASLLRSAPVRAASPEALPRLGWFNFVYLHVGALDRTLEFYEDGVDAGYSVSASNMLLWLPYYVSLRKTERYKDFMRKRGVVEYWRKRGWPELCRPLNADDFACS